MLKDWRELIINFLFYELRLDYYYWLTAALSIDSPLKGEGLIIFLQPNVLVEFGKCLRESEVVSYSLLLLRTICNSTWWSWELFLVVSHQEMLLELIYCNKALQAWIHIAEVWIVLKTHYALWNLLENFNSLLLLFLFFYPLGQRHPNCWGWHHFERV